MRLLDSFQDREETTLLIGPNQALKQSLVVEHNNFAGLRLRLYNPKLGSTDPYLLKIWQQDGVMVLEQLLSGMNIGWGDWVRVDFAPVVSSAGKTFTFSLQAVIEASAEAALVDDFNMRKIDLNYQSDIKTREQDLTASWVSIGYSRENEFANGSAWMGNTELSGDLLFQAYYQAGVGQVPKEVVGNIVTKLKLDLGFVFQYGVCLGIIVWLISRRIKANRDK